MLYGVNLFLKIPTGRQINHKHQLFATIMKIKRSLILLFLIISHFTMQAQYPPTSTGGLDARQGSLATIAALTASGNVLLLDDAFNKGLDAGLTINEIKEALVQLYAYCGFPRSLNALNTFKSCLDKRTARGLRDQQGAPIVENVSSDKYEQGRQVLELLTGMHQAKPAPGFGEFAPRIDAFLKEHLFADIFSSDVLNFAQRELVTISALAAMPGVESQLKSHLSMGRNTGITDAQLKDLSDIIEMHGDSQLANTLRSSIGSAVASSEGTQILLRLSEIEVHSQHLEDYLAMLKIEAETSVRLEPGVVAIFPMMLKEHPERIRIVEVYKDKQAYESHLQTPHFQYYKQNTLSMIKSLSLVDMKALDLSSMIYIFRKVKF